MIPLPTDTPNLRSTMGWVAEASTSRHLTILPSGQDWQPFADGIEIKVLHEAEGTLSYLLRLQPHAVLPAHRHRQPEECMVLEGELRIGDHLRAPAGTYHLADTGTFHAPITTDRGAVIFLRGSEPSIGDLV